MRFDAKPDVVRKGEVGLPAPEREGLGAALRSVFGRLDKPMSDELEDRLAKIDPATSGSNRRR